MSELMTAEQAIESLDNAHLIVYTAASEDVLLQVSPLIDKAQDFIRTQSARVAELEKEKEEIQTTLDFYYHEFENSEKWRQAARWRSCKDEPPPRNGEHYLVRYLIDHKWTVPKVLYQRDGIYHNTDGSGVCGAPDEWRAIT